MKSAIITIVSLGLALNAFGQSDADLVRSSVSKNDIEAHIYFLASDELRGRATGSHEIDIAASYLANQLRRYGVEPAGDNGTYYQEVTFQEKGPAETLNLVSDKLSGGKFITISAHNTDYNGQAIYLEYGSESDFESNDVKGKLVVVKAGDAEGDDMMSSYGAGKKKLNLAKKYGAAGLIELISLSDKEYDRMAGHFNGVSIALAPKDEADKLIHLWRSNTDSDPTESWTIGESFTLSLSITGIDTKKIGGRNVIGYSEGSDPVLKDEFVVYSAHYDHVGIGKPNAEMDSIYNGARDNAVGTVTVLNAAENLSKFPTKRSSLFIFFTGEEKGLLGSQYFVENPTIALNQMVYCFNSDNGGYNDTSKTTIIGLNRTTAADHFKTAATEFGLTAIGDPVPELNLFDRSDNVHFARAGIPAPSYGMGFTAFDEEMKKYYHQVTDNPDTMDYDYLYKFFQSYVLSARLIANDPETPFWTEGDKYYEAGIELYKKSEKEPERID